MKIKVWVVSTCIPEPGEGPCFPDVFGSEAESEACADQYMKDEWSAISPEDKDTCDPLPYPGDWREAQDILVDYAGPSWGTYEITSHEVELAEASNV